MKRQQNRKKNEGIEASEWVMKWFKRPGKIFRAPCEGFENDDLKLLVAMEAKKRPKMDDMSARQQ